MLQTVPLTENTQLEPGIYYLSLALPNRVITRLGNSPVWIDRFVQELISRTNRKIQVQGYGPTWLQPEAGGSPELVFSIKFEFMGEAGDDLAGDVQLAALPIVPVLAIGSILISLGAVIGVSLLLRNARQLAKEVGDIPGIEDGLATGLNISRILLVGAVAGAAYFFMGGEK